MALTDIAIRTAKPADKPIKLTDGGGLYLLLNPDGSRWWRLDYRYGGLARGAFASSSKSAGHLSACGASFAA